MRSRRHAVWLGSGLVALQLILVAGLAPAWADPIGHPPANAPRSSGYHGAAPPGNNGTIKIDGVPLDAGHDNDPHVGCAFTLEFFGYDAGTNTADVTFTAHSPTGTGTLRTDRFAFTDTRSHGGATFDADRPYDLSSAVTGLSPSRQGYHVAVSVSVDGGPPKHKVFWMSPCARTGSGAVVAPGASGSSRPAVTESGPAPETSSAPSGHASPSTGATVPPAAVAGEAVTRMSPTSASPTVGAVHEAATLPFTGRDVFTIVAAALLALVVGAALVVAAPSQRPVSRR